MIGLPFRAWRLMAACAFAATALAVAAPAQPAFAAESIHSIITRCTLAAGFSAADVVAMKKIADYESRDRRKKQDGRNFGLFQLNRSICKGRPWSDAEWNTKRALKYVKGRYRTPSRAWKRIKKTGWY